MGAGSGAGLTVVTGATGHLGANLVRVLLSSGRRVRAVGRHPARALDGLDVEWCTADLLDPPAIRASLAGAEVVYHLAAVISITGDPTGLVWATNVGGVATVAAAALECGVRRLVHCSSVHAFDVERCRSSLDEDSQRSLRAELPVYDRSKAAGEVQLRAVVERGLDAVVVNPTGVIGPNDFEPSRMGRFFLGLADRRLPALVRGDFDWVDVRDVAAALVAAESRGRRGESYLVAGHRRSLRELADLAGRVTGVPPPRVTVPMSLAELGARLMPTGGGDQRGSPLFTLESLHALKSCPTISGRKAELELGHSPRPLEESVSDLYEWFGRSLAGR